MASWVLFFVVWGKFGTSSVNVEFTTQQQCESARSRASAMIPANKDGYFQYSGCFQR